MIGRYAYFKNSSYKDVSVKGEYSPITNRYSLISSLVNTLFKNSDYYPDTLSFNYTDIEYRQEPNKISIDEITLDLFYMIPYTLYIASDNNVTSLMQSSVKPTINIDKEDILLDLNNVPHRDNLYALNDDSMEYILAPQSSDWQLLLAYMENSKRN